MAESSEVKEAKAVEEGPSRSEDLSKTLPEDAFNNYLQGKRHMLVQDYKFAVQSLSTACELYVKHFGELAVECGEVHFLYGKALFRLSQQQAGVLGGALNEDVTEDEEEEQGKSSEEDGKDSERNDSDTGNGEENPEDAEVANEETEPSESTDSPQANPEEVAKDSNDKSEPMQTTEAAADATLNESNAEKKPEEEDLDDLELAWESLETAKSIFLRQANDNVEAQLKVSEILQLLAEISMESDNNLAAITDLKESLEIRKHHLKSDDRLLAETYYQMGLAQMLEKMYRDAINNFNTTMEILNLRIKNLKNTPVTDTVGNFESAEHEKEIEDLESVLLDIKEKVEDTKELIKDAAKVKEEISTRLLGSEAEEEAFPSPEKSEKTAKPVSNITHLLKRKKPEQDEDKDRDLKRAKLTSNVQNGDSKIPE